MALPATMGQNPPTMLVPLGQTKVTSAGTAVKITHNYTDLDIRIAHYLEITANSSNSGLIYVICEPPLSTPPWTLPGGGTTSGADTTNFMNVVKILQAGQSWAVPSFMLNMLTLGQFWIDAGTNNDYVIANFGEA